MKTQLVKIFTFTLALALPLLFPVLLAAEKVTTPPTGGRLDDVTLTVRESSELKGGEPVSRKTIQINTGTMKYELVYKSLKGSRASMNGKLLNDGQCGFGMLKPYEYWYSNGFILPSIDPKDGGVLHDLVNTEADLKVLESSGARIAFDLVWKFNDAQIIIRTAALAGREELFVSVLASAGCPLRAGFLAYPLGFAGGFNEGPRDRWIHVEGGDIQHPKMATLDLGKAPWMLLTDHLLNPEGTGGQLGLIFDKSRIEKATVDLASNYGVKPVFEAKGDSPEMRFILCTFGPMSWQQARDALASLAREADALMDRAFHGLPSAK